MPYQYSITSSHLALHSSQGRGFFSLHFCPWNLASKDQQMPKTADSKTCYISCYFHFLLYLSTEDTSSMPNTYHPPLATWGKKILFSCSVSWRNCLYNPQWLFAGFIPIKYHSPLTSGCLKIPNYKFSLRASLYIAIHNHGISVQTHMTVFFLFSFCLMLW